MWTHSFTYVIHEIDKLNTEFDKTRKNIDVYE